MNRRKFIKDTAAIAAVLAVPAVLIAKEQVETMPFDTYCSEYTIIEEWPDFDERVVIYTRELEEKIIRQMYDTCGIPDSMLGKRT